MTSQISCVSENSVRDGTALYTNFLLLHQINQLLILRQCKAMADSFRSDQDSVVELFVFATVAFTSMEVNLKITI